MTNVLEKVKINVAETRDGFNPGVSDDVVVLDDLVRDNIIGSVTSGVVFHLLLAIVLLVLEVEDLLTELIVLCHQFFDELLVFLEFILLGLGCHSVGHDLFLSASLLAADSKKIGASAMTLSRLVGKGVLTVSKSFVSLSLAANSGTILTASFFSFSIFILRAAIMFWTCVSKSSFASEWHIYTMVTEC